MADAARNILVNIETTATGDGAQQQVQLLEELKQKAQQVKEELDKLQEIAGDKGGSDAFRQQNIEPRVAALEQLRAKIAEVEQQQLSAAEAAPKMGAAIEEAATKSSGAVNMLIGGFGALGGLMGGIIMAHTRRLISMVAHYAEKWSGIDDLKKHQKDIEDVAKANHKVNEEIDKIVAKETEWEEKQKRKNESLEVQIQHMERIVHLAQQERDLQPEISAARGRNELARIGLAEEQGTLSHEEAARQRSMVRSAMSQGTYRHDQEKRERDLNRLRTEGATLERGIAADDALLSVSVDQQLGSARGVLDQMQGLEHRRDLTEKDRERAFEILKSLPPRGDKRYIADPRLYGLRFDAERVLQLEPGRIAEFDKQIGALKEQLPEGITGNAVEDRKLLDERRREIIQRRDRAQAQLEKIREEQMRTARTIAAQREIHEYDADTESIGERRAIDDAHRKDEAVAKHNWDAVAREEAAQSRGDGRADKKAATDFSRDLKAQEGEISRLLKEAIKRIGDEDTQARHNEAHHKGGPTATETQWHNIRKISQEELQRAGGDLTHAQSAADIAKVMATIKNVESHVSAPVNQMLQGVEKQIGNMDKLISKVEQLNAKVRAQEQKIQSLENTHD